ncbi:S41 family peptidase [Thermosynechococcaceae cyanobacterium BACA0444]|uniref:C-terminal processing peptidase n=1 Tax=Pseudocalidococcus azoricus BACA0444 TaxID=2918990 RepID=A0AAE4JWF2_9CYAN|nr:carboxyl-terminal processing protease CtpA [Pseudocalidococcus azoricus]MDS3860083.1 S41 family peptidase [Pseudocalidococcus azoricus BACA0444]
MGRGFRHYSLGLILGILGLAWAWFGVSSTALALTTEQKLYNEAWKIVSQSYVDETFNGQNWWNVRQEALRQPLETREATYEAIQKMLASLGDPFTRLLRPAQYHSLQTSTTGELTGVGLQIASEPDTGYLQVIAPIAGSPAAAAGLLPQDKILKIDATPTPELTLDEAAERMRGEVGSTVVLTVIHPQGDQQPIEIPVKRDHITLNPVISQLQTAPTGAKIGYVRLTQFNAMATDEMHQALSQLEKQGVDRYVLDLRNNPGGLLQAGVEIAELFIEPGVVVYTVDRQGVLGSFTTTHQPLTKDPLVVLVNQGTASASEILAGALQDTGRAQLVGEQTFGKGSIQSLFNLSDGSGLAVTIAHYETPAHHDINKIGIAPDLRVPLTPITQDQVATDADSQYQAALKTLTLHNNI